MRAVRNVMGAVFLAASLAVAIVIVIAVVTATGNDTQKDLADALPGSLGCMAD